MNSISAKHHKFSKFCRILCTTAEKSSPAGFTLIEVMIALFVLVLIGTTTAKAVVDAAKLREVLRDETEFASEFRTSVAFIERDLNQTFNPRWYLAADFKPIDPNNPQANQPKTTTSGTANAVGGNTTSLSIEDISRRTRGMAFQPTDYWGPVIDPTGIRPSRFKGNNESFSFITSSHTRIYQQKKESIYSKVRYMLIKQPSNPNLSDEQNAKNSAYSALVKIENTRAFDLEDPKEAPYINTYVILNNVKKVKFSYFKRDEKDPANEWDSESQQQKWIFPLAVQMELTVVGPKERIIDEKLMFFLETPNDLLPKTY